MQDFMFKMAEDETYCVSGYLGDEEEVVIPAEHGGAPVTILGDGLFAGQEAADDAAPLIELPPST